jgi:pimeloyl-ACP methyl ester carboxylesterase
MTLKKYLYDLSRRGTVLFILLGALSNFVAFAQTPGGAATRKTTVAEKTKSAKKCSGGWSGTITYTKTTNQSETNKTPTGYITGSSNYTATAEITVEENGSWRASVKVNTKGVIEDVKEGSECCSISLAGCTKNGTFKYSDVIRTEASAEGSAQSSRGLNIAGDAFDTNFSLPEAVGKSVRTVDIIRVRTCDGVNQNSSIPQESQASFSVGPIHLAGAVDPNNPNVIRGTQKDGDVTVTYDLTRCAEADIKLTDLALDEHVFPDPKEWKDVGGKTVDGNLVRIRAKVRNDGDAAGYASVKISETSENVELGSSSVALKPGEEREIETEWDTSGYAWSNDGKPKTLRRIKAEVDDQSLTEDVSVVPKPVILVHGLWANAAGWSDYQSYLNEAHSFAWKAFPVGARPDIAKMSTGDHLGNYQPTNSIFQNAQELGKEIKKVREDENAWHVDLVAHSMGGLISRFYIHSFMQPVFDGKPEAAHLVMLGTPNQGSPCADLVGGVFDFFEQPMEAMRQLRPSVVAEFNRQITNRKNVKFSILAGFPVPFVCQAKEWGDGVVTIPSALWQIADRSFAPREHTSLTGREDFRGFVLPRLALGPKKAANAGLRTFFEDNYALTDADRQDRFEPFMRRVSFERTKSEKLVDELSMRQKIELQPRESKEIEISSTGENLGVILVAPPAVAATLKDASGTVAGENKGADAGKNPFRVINVEKSASGTYKLKLENTGSEAAVAFVGAWNSAPTNSSFTIDAGKPSPAGGIALTAKLIENGAPVTGAKITATISGTTVEIELLDDGRHGDGASGDGVYGGTVKKLAAGEYFVEARAETGGKTKIAVARILE